MVLFFETVSVRLESLRGVRSSGFTDNQGNFNFRAVPLGIYEVIVEADRNRFESVSTKVEVFPNSPSVVTVVLRLRKDAVESKPGGNTVSTGELDPDIPAAAKKEFELGAAAAKTKTPTKPSHICKRRFFSILVI